MEEEVLFKTEERVSRDEIADRLRDAAEQLESGDVRLVSERAEQSVKVPEEATFEVELERQGETTGDYYELEFELSWNE